MKNVIISVAVLALSICSLSAQTIDEIVSQHLNALGGETKLKTVKSIFMENTIKVQALEMANQTNILVPKPDKNISKEKRKGHSRRAAIEPVIGHLKSNYRMGRNYLKGVVGDQINVLLAAAAMNFKRVINLWTTEANFRWKLIYIYIVNIYQNIFAQFLKMTF